MSTAVVPGSFDPVSLGHIDLIERAAAAFDTVYAVCMVNWDKKYLFPLEVREQLLKDAVKHLKNVIVESYDGWMCDYVKLKNATAIVKGVRNAGDFEYEVQHAVFNKQYSGVDTFFVLSRESLKDVSSSAIREAIEKRQSFEALAGKETADSIKNILEGKYEREHS